MNRLQPRPSQRYVFIQETESTTWGLSMHWVLTQNAHPGEVTLLTCFLFSSSSASSRSCESTNRWGQSMFKTTTPQGEAKRVSFRVPRQTNNPCGCPQEEILVNAAASETTSGTPTQIQGFRRAKLRQVRRLAGSHEKHGSCYPCITSVDKIECQPCQRSSLVF